MTESTTGENVVTSNASITVDDEQQSLPLVSDGSQTVDATTTDTTEATSDLEDDADLAHSHEPVEAHDEHPHEEHHHDEAFFYGPVGKCRHPVLVIALCVVTFGLYGLLWHNRNNHEMADFDPQMRVHAGRSTWAVAVPWILGLLVTLAGAARLILIEANVSLPFDTHISETIAAAMLGGLLVVPYLTFLLPFSAVAVVMTAERIRIIEEASGVTSDQQLRPAASLPLLLIPLAGPMILIARLQSRINATWERISPTPGRRRQ